MPTEMTPMTILQSSPPVPHLFQTIHSHDHDCPSRYFETCVRDDAQVWIPKFLLGPVHSDRFLSALFNASSSQEILSMISGFFLQTPRSPFTKSSKRGSRPESLASSLMTTGVVSVISHYENKHAASLLTLYCWPDSYDARRR